MRYFCTPTPYFCSQKLIIHSNKRQNEHNRHLRTDRRHPLSERNTLAHYRWGNPSRHLLQCLPSLLRENADAFLHLHHIHGNRRRNAVSVSRPPHVKRNSMTLKMGILTEEYNFFRFFHCQFGNISYFCSWIRILYRFIDILNSEARASFSPNGNLRTSCPTAICEGGECRAVVSALTGADFCHIPPSRFLRTSVAEYRREVCASVYI